MINESVEELRSQFLGGQSDKLKDIYKATYSDVVKILLSKNICNKQDVDDYFNESMIVLYDSVISRKLSDLKSIKSYLVGVCKNLARRDVAKKSNVEKKEDELRLLFYNENDYSIDDQDNKSIKKLIYAAIDDLSNHCKQIILAFYIDQISMKEIAQRFELANANVAKTMKGKCFKKLLTIVETKSKDAFGG